LILLTIVRRLVGDVQPSPRPGRAPAVGTAATSTSTSRRLGVDHRNMANVGIHLDAGHTGHPSGSNMELAIGTRECQSRRFSEVTSLRELTQFLEHEIWIL